MLPSLVRRSSLALVVSFVLNGCGGRSLDADVVQWYDTDPEGEEGGEYIGSSKGGAFYGTKSTKGGSTFLIKSTTQYRSETGPAGGSYSKSTKATMAVGGYKSSSSKPTSATGGYKSSSSKPTSATGGYENSTYRSSYVGGRAGATSGQGGRAGATTAAAAGSYPRGGTSGATSVPNAAGASWCAPNTVCNSTCQSGYWVEPQGCYSCSCAPPVTQLAYSDPTLGVLSCPVASLSLASAVSTVQNRWDFVFTWTCLALIAGQPITGTVHASISSVPSDEIGRTHWLNDALPTLSIEQAQLSSRTGLDSSTIIALAAKPAGTWLSLKRQGSYVHGGIYFVGTPSSGENVTLTGEFILAAPN